MPLAATMKSRQLSLCASRRPPRICHIPNSSQFYRIKFPNNVQLHTSYEEDVHAAYSSTSHQEVTDTLTEKRDRKISAAKSCVPLLTCDTHQSHLHPIVTLDNSPLLLKRHAKLHVMTFDTHFSSSQNVLTVKKGNRTRHDPKNTG